MARRGKQDKGRSGLSRSDWERLVAEHGESSLTRGAFCAEHGVSVSSFDYWRRKLREEQASSPGFIELGRLGGGWDVEVELGGGMVLRLRRG